jgi:hypothetical protein
MSSQEGVDALGVANLADGVLSVTLDRPDSLNSLTYPMLLGLADTTERADADPRIKVAARPDRAALGYRLPRRYPGRSNTIEIPSSPTAERVRQRNASAKITHANKMSAATATAVNCVYRCRTLPPLLAEPSVTRS